MRTKINLHLFIISMFAAFFLLEISGCGLKGEKKYSNNNSDTIPSSKNVIRLATVTTIQTGGLLDTLIADFEKKTDYRVEVYAGSDAYQRARAAKADVVFSHWGHRDLQAFVREGLGEWPQAVLSNTVGFLVPNGDPAHVGTAKDPLEAFERIAKTKSVFVMNNLEGLQYLINTLWNAAGRPDKTGWYFEDGSKRDSAIKATEKMNGYSIWGVSPFLEYKKNNNTTLRLVVLNSPLMQRLMVSVVVSPTKLQGINEQGAKAFQAYLLDPETQGMILEFRVSDISLPLFWPQGRTNASSNLPK